MDKSPNNNTINNLAKSSKNTEGNRPDPEIKSLIYEIRGQQVMLDSDLAKLYQCKNGTKDINKAVKRNLQKFPGDFYFQLSHEEYTNLLRFHSGTSNPDVGRGGRQYIPYVFTEQGVAMLASVLHTEIAGIVSVNIMRAFVAMKKYISGNLIEQKYINNLVLSDHERIKLLEQLFEKFEKKEKLTGIYFDGHIYDAYSRILEIFSEAKESLTIIDAYTDIITLNIIKRLNIPIAIITSKSAPLKPQDVKKYQEQYSNLTIIYDNTFHDRYFILDGKTVYHCGASINRIGHKTFSITKINDQEIVAALLSKIAPK